MSIEIRKAAVADVPALQRLINDYANRGLMLPRSLHSLYEHLRDYSVAADGDEIAGCIALHISWKDLAEIRSLAVGEGWQHRGLGRELVQKALDEALAFGVRRIFVLTFVPEFFTGLGFKLADKAELPHKIWQDCIHCIHFPDCGEVALTRTLS